MKFKILSVRDDSVRVKTGIVTFDIKIVDNVRLVLPPHIFIAYADDFNNLTGAVLAEYNKSMEFNKSNDNEKAQVYN